MPALQVNYIKTEEELHMALEVLTRQTEIALDLEFDRERYSYGSTICLIQIFAAGQCYLIDPVSGPSPLPLYRYLEDPAITKIMHAPGEDLQILHLQACFPVHIFDTERAARLLNYEAFSLSSLLQSILGITLNKSVQKTDWTRRPLSESQIQYACSDVAWLPALRDALWDAADKTQIRTWVEEENMAWDTYRAEVKPEGMYTHRDDAKKYVPYDLFLLNELLKFRDAHAKRMNKPGYMVISREVLDALLIDQDTLRNWVNQKGIHQSLRNDDIRRSLELLLAKAAVSAQSKGLGKKHPPRQSKEGPYRSRQEIKDEVEQIFRPIKHEIARKWGEHCAAYILNEKTMTELCSGSKKLSGMAFPYRIKLLESIAEELKIKLEKYT
jgi:ribonuclease D